MRERSDGVESGNQAGSDEAAEAIDVAERPESGQSTPRPASPADEKPQRFRSIFEEGAELPRIQFSDEPAVPAVPAVSAVSEVPAAPEVPAARLVSPFLENVPWACIAVAAAMIAIFAVEHWLILGARRAELGVTGDTIVALGGLAKGAVLEEGEWHRLFSSAFLHVSLRELALGIGAIAFCGWPIEDRCGRAWPLAIYTLGILAGNGGMLCFLGEDILVAGNEAGAGALLAAAAVLTYRLPRTETEKATLRTGSWISVVAIVLVSNAVINEHQPASALQLLFSSAVGALLGLFLRIKLRSATRLASPPPLLWPARAVAGLGVLLFAVSFALVAIHYASYRAQYERYTTPPEINW